MIAIDTNLLVYAHRRELEWHQAAADRITSLAQGAAPWAIPWPCVHEFLAVVTHPRIFTVPTPIDLAVDQVRAWQESPSLTFLAEGPGYFAVLSDLLDSAKPRGSAVRHARVAALCLHHGVRELWTADRDFLAFPRLSVRNPLIG